MSFLNTRGHVFEDTVHPKDFPSSVEAVADKPLLPVVCFIAQRTSETTSASHISKKLSDPNDPGPPALRGHHDKLHISKKLSDLDSILLALGGTIDAAVLQELGKPRMATISVTLDEHERAALATEQPRV